MRGPKYIIKEAKGNRSQEAVQTTCRSSPRRNAPSYKLFVTVTNSRILRVLTILRKQQPQKQSTVKQKMRNFNVGSEDAAGDWREELGMDIELFDAFVSFGALLDDSADYHIENVEDAYWKTCQGNCLEPMNSHCGAMNSV